jgi:hypothetical protein
MIPTIPPTLLTPFLLDPLGGGGGDTTGVGEAGTCAGGDLGEGNGAGGREGKGAGEEGKGAGGEGNGGGGFGAGTPNESCHMHKNIQSLSRSLVKSTIY